MPTLHEAAQTLEQLQTEYKARFDSYEKKTLPDGTVAPDIPANDIEQLQKLQSDIDAAGKTFQSLKAAVNAYHGASETLNQMTQVQQFNVGQSAAPTSNTSVAKAFSAQLANLRSAGMGIMGASVDLPDYDLKSLIHGAEFKTTMTTGAGWAPLVQRNPGATLSIQRPIQLIDVLPTRPTTQNGLRYMVESTFTDNAAGAAEASAVGEQALAYTDTTGAIEKIGAFIPVSEVQLDDEPGIQSFIEERLAFAVRRELDRQCTVGSGSTPTLRGLYNATNVQTQAKGTDSAYDAVYKAIVAIRVSGRATADVICMHSNDWRDIRLARSSDGMYLFGPPSIAEVPQLWGLPVVFNEALTESNAMVAATQEHVTLVYRTGLNIAVTNAHASNFTASVLAIRATIRAGLEIRRGEAICRVTGI